MKKLKWVGIAIGLVLLLAIIAAVVFAICCHNLATQDNISDKYTLSEDEYEENYLSDVLKGAVRDEDFVLTENVVNTFIYQKYCTSFSKNSSGLENLRVRFHEDKYSEIYARVFIKGQRYAISSKAEIECTGEKGCIEITLHDMKIGELAISDDILKYLLPKYLGGSESFMIDENRITVKGIYTYETKHSEIELYLIKFSPVDDGVCCRTNSLKKEALDAVKDYILSDDFKEDVSRAYDALKKVFSF